MTKGVTPDIVRALPDCGIEPEEFFSLDMLRLLDRLGLNTGIKFQNIQREEALIRAKKEAEFIKRHSIKAYSLLDDDYPSLLREIPDAPIILYKLGDADLDCTHILGLVGTRKPSVYGMEFCNKFIEEIGGYFPDVCIVSGLAYGIDSASHKAALDHKLSTVAVLAHGLDMIYPASHRELARMIIKNNGALVTEYPSGTTPYAQRFLERNRIVVGLTPLTIVAESNIKGGAMSTAHLAFSYDREVMAVPGRITDPLSSGTNHLIRKEKAHLLTSAADVIEMMDWRPLGVKIEPRQRNLFPELEGTAKQIYEILKFKSEPATIDTLHSLTQITIAELKSTLIDLEFDGIVNRYPGNRYGI